MKLSLVILFMCFMSSICFDSYWRYKSDKLIAKSEELELRIIQTEIEFQDFFSKYYDDNE